jgi:hypothetical protein
MQRHAHDAAARRDAEFQATLSDVVAGIIGGGGGITAEMQAVGAGAAPSWPGKPGLRGLERARAWATTHAGAWRERGAAGSKAHPGALALAGARQVLDDARAARVERQRALHSEWRTQVFDKIQVRRGVHRG